MSEEDLKKIKEEFTKIIKQFGGKATLFLAMGYQDDDQDSAVYLACQGQYKDMALLVGTCYGNMTGGLAPDRHEKDRRSIQADSIKTMVAYVSSALERSIEEDDEKKEFEKHEPDATYMDGFILHNKGGNS